ncbi:DNA cytosine methyltransferase [Shewanella marisflavi]|uniref:DNA cytosine methyltransferase n=1 Tax=Shewanella marisflavi TaxID=260364 RepID=UPI003AACF908
MIEFMKTKIHQQVGAALGNLEALTKRLKVMRTGKDKRSRKIVISSKDLLVSGLAEGTKFVLEMRAHGGFFVRPATISDTQFRTVSYRSYANRKGVEPVVDIRHQQQLEMAIGNAEHVHIVFSKTGVTITPVTSHEAIASQSTTGAVIAIDTPDESGLYSGMIRALDLIREKHFSTISFEFDEDFAQSHEYTLLSIQLKRLGYELTNTGEMGLIAAMPGGNPDKTEYFDAKPLASSNPERAELIRRHFNKEQVTSTFTACTAGVDVNAMEQEGFVNLQLLDWRPHEKRDYKRTTCSVTGKTKVTLTDKSDTGALCAAINSKSAKVVFNEDIYEFDPTLVKNLIKSFNFIHLSISCDEFSLLKNNKQKQKDNKDLTTTRDMFLPALNIIKQTLAPTVLVENVRQFNDSIEAKLFIAGLKSLGYEVYQQIIHAKDQNGMTSRERSFLFASALGAPFSFPEGVTRTAHAWNDVIVPRLHELRDVSHCVSVRKGVETGRIRLIKPHDAVAPTITKSQSRQTKDAVYLAMAGKYYMPSNAMLRDLMGIPSSFNTDFVSGEMETEIIGQSIEVPMHRNICQRIKDHLKSFANVTEMVSQLAETAIAKPVRKPAPKPLPFTQMPLF